MKLFVAIALFLISPIPAYAGVVISEIMYDLEGTDTKREWIEITNTGGGSIDATTLIFFEANTSHKIKSSGGSPLLSSGVSAIIALDAEQFRSDHPSYGGVLLDSSWSSLSNDGESLEIRDAESDVLDRITYDKSYGAAGNGMSLERRDHTFVEGSPTPGSASLSFVPSPPPAPPPQEEKKVETSPQVVAPVVEPQTTLPEPPKDVPLPESQTSSAEMGAVPQEVKPSVTHSEVKKDTASPQVPRKVEKPKILPEKETATLPDAVPVFERPRESDVLLAQAEQANAGSDSLWMYILALVALLGVASVGAVLVSGGTRASGKDKTNEADSYTIVE